MCYEKAFVTRCRSCGEITGEESQLQACAAALARGGNLWCVGPGYQRAPPHVDREGMPCKWCKSREAWISARVRQGDVPLQVSADVTGEGATLQPLAWNAETGSWDLIW